MIDKKNVFSKSKKQLLSEKIHDEILEMIIKNATDEDMVLNEGRLMEVFQVSKAPVREALIKLCAEGVLQSVPRYGYLSASSSRRMRILLTSRLSFSCCRITKYPYRGRHGNLRKH